MVHGKDSATFCSLMVLAFDLKQLVSHLNALHQSMHKLIAQNFAFAGMSVTTLANYGNRCFECNQRGSRA